MSKFIALYLVPAGALEEWAKVDHEQRKAEEARLQNEWHVWAQKVKGHLLETAGAGKTKRVSAQGVEDAKNNIMLYSFVEAESHEVAAKLFEGHPHLQIPGATIEVMTANVLPEMGEV